VCASILRLEFAAHVRRRYVHLSSVYNDKMEKSIRRKHSGPLPADLLWGITYVFWPVIAFLFDLLVDVFLTESVIRNFIYIESAARAQNYASSLMHFSVCIAYHTDLIFCVGVVVIFLMDCSYADFADVAFSLAKQSIIAGGFIPRKSHWSCLQ